METKLKGKGAINIALVKYWGKADETEIIPLNNSISITLDTSTFFTDMEISLSDDEDCLILNGKEEKLNNRIKSILEYLRKETGNTKAVKIITSNNFPTAAGCASSASSMSILALLLTRAFDYKLKYEGEVSAIARSSNKQETVRQLFKEHLRWFCRVAR